MHRWSHWQRKAFYFWCQVGDPHKTFSSIARPQQRVPLLHDLYHEANLRSSEIILNCTFNCLWIMNYSFPTNVSGRQGSPAAVDSQCLACELYQSSPEVKSSSKGWVTPTGAAEDWGRSPWFSWLWWSAGQEGVSLVAQRQFLALLPFPQEEGGRSGPQQIVCWNTPQKRLDLASIS